MGEGFYIYINGEVNYLYRKSESRSVSDFSDFNRSKEHHGRLLVYPGIAYEVTKSIHLELRTGNLFNVSYLDQKKHMEWPVSNKRDEHLRYFNIISSFNETFNNLGIGFRFLLNGREQVKTSGNSRE